ncbi:unnamed protein product [Gemmataceae bacterium]|nr:unnamed protein product [Gemmataceae bacterium]VTT99519.1 unnamed protein product [Gemmataceae bacterium]
MQSGLIEVPLGGGQVRFPVPVRPPTYPPTFRDLATAVERTRAKDAWNAALRLKALVELWVRFLTCGTLRWRLAEETEAVVTGEFPELDTLGTVLNALATQADAPAGRGDELAGVERLCGIVRGPTQRHLHDRLQNVGPAALYLLRAFQKLMLTEAGCLHRLDVNSDHFRRPWEVLRSEVELLTRIDGDWSGDEVVLGFGGALRSPDLLRVSGTWRTALTELTELLQRYPATALARGDTPSPASANARRRKAGMSRDEANRCTAEYLRQDPTAKSGEIAKAIGCSGGLVRGTLAWRSRKPTAPKSSAPPRRRGVGKAVGLDIGLEIEAERRFKDQKDFIEAGGGDEGLECEPPLSREDELERLEREQKRDMRQRRVPRRP